MFIFVYHVLFVEGYVNKLDQSFKAFNGKGLVLYGYFNRVGNGPSRETIF